MIDKKLERLRDAWSDLHSALMKLDLPDDVKEKMRKMSVAVNSILLDMELDDDGYR